MLHSPYPGIMPIWFRMLIVAAFAAVIIGVIFL
jgi:hypothetical protein